MTVDVLAEDLALAEQNAGRPAPAADDVLGILEELARDGFIVRDGVGWFVA